MKFIDFSFKKFDSLLGKSAQISFFLQCLQKKCELKLLWLHLLSDANRRYPGLEFADIWQTYGKLKMGDKNLIQAKVIS